MGIETEQKATNRGLHSIFEDEILPQELAALANRSSAATRPAEDPGGLPDFARCVVGEDQQSPFFQHTLHLLEDGAQNGLWRDWAADAPAKRHPGLTGLALSGGGIRSSTLNMGIV